MRNARRISLAMLTAAAAALVLLVAPVAAGGNTQFSAIGTFDPGGLQCHGPSAYPYPPVVMSGDIVGCWYTDSYTIEQSTPSGTYVETGKETFVGCLADETTCGTFSTTYRFEGKSCRPTAPRSSGAASTRS